MEQNVLITRLATKTLAMCLRCHGAVSTCTIVHEQLGAMRRTVLVLGGVRGVEKKKGPRLYDYRGGSLPALLCF
jgi:hypothetical protein